MSWEPVIGLEVHVQLRTETKLFCGCPNRFGEPPNTLVCPVCLGLPGALPVLNEKPVEYGIRLGLAIGAEIQPESRFARKNYFYPDLPKNYQISQYDRPLIRGGGVEIGTDEERRSIPIERIHLEEDAGKSFHPESAESRQRTRVDFNRAGVPLLEMVTEPALRSSEEAYRYLHRLRQLVRVLGITDGDMEKGSLRCDANVSLRRRGESALGVKTEIKNLNSIRGVERGIEAEIRRQTERLDAGDPIETCTLLYDADLDVLAVMRSKELAHDYRYFPEPDLPPVLVAEEEIESVRRALPELPDARRRRYESELGLSAYDAQVLTEDYELAAYYEDLLAAGAEAKPAANWVMGEVSRVLKSASGGIAALQEQVPPERLASLLALLDTGVVSGNLAKELFVLLLEKEGDPETLAREAGLVQESDRSALEEAVRGVIDEHPGPVGDFVAGKQKAFAFLMGQVMRATGGKANPKVVRELLQEALTSRRKMGET